MLVSMVRTPGARRPSSGWAVMPTAVVSISLRAATTGSVTRDWTSGWGGTASGWLPPATRTRPLPSPTPMTLPRASMSRTSRPR